jgi:hypothetical protein
LSPGIDYPVEKNCSGRRNSSQLFACNDISTIGTIGAFREPGFRVPNACIS